MKIWCWCPRFVQKSPVRFVEESPDTAVINKSTILKSLKEIVVRTERADSVPLAGPGTGHAPRPAMAQPWSQGGKTSISNVARLGRAGQSRKDAVEKV